MKVLIIGCGAVGQVFGLFLQNAGVELGLYDRPVVTEKLEQALVGDGLPLYQVRRRRQVPIAHRLKNVQVIPDLAEARRFNPDQVWLTIPSPAYYTAWFRQFLREVPSCRLVSFIPEGPRPDFLPESEKDRFVFGGTTFMAWQADLETGGPGRGVSFWRPPMGIPLVGAEEACREVGTLLKKAGFRVTTSRLGSPAQASGTAVITAFVAGLELSGWSLRAFRKGPWLKLAARASSEAVQSQLPPSGRFTKALLAPLTFSAGLSLAASLMPLLVPFDVEKYLKFHYMKTREQSLALLKLYIEDGKKRANPVDHLQALLQSLASRSG